MKLGTSFALATVLSIALCLGGALAAVAAGPTAAADGWVVYHDALYDVTLEYPADWQVVPHAGREDLGGVITLTTPRTPEGSLSADPHHGPRKIVFGPYLTARENGMDAGTWRLLRDERFAPYERNVGAYYSSQRVAVASRAAAQTFEETPLGPSRSTDIPRGQIMWFLWDDADPAQTEIYDRILGSLRFGRATPHSLQDLYGTGFRAASVLAPEESGHTLAQRALSDFRVPLNGSHTAKCSNTHNKVQTDDAVDVFLSVGNYLYAAATGEVLHADWWNNYGKLLKLKTDSYEHFYGHLSNFYYTFPGSTVGKGWLVGFTGNTGIGDPHLHFEIRNRNNNQGVNMGAVSGFAENGNYPGQNGVQVISCGTWSY